MAEEVDVADRLESPVREACGQLLAPQFYKTLVGASADTPVDGIADMQLNPIWCDYPLPLGHGRAVLQDEDVATEASVVEAPAVAVEPTDGAGDTDRGDGAAAFLTDEDRRAVIQREL